MYVFMCMYVCMCVCMYVYIHVCMYVSIVNYKYCINCYYIEVCIQEFNYYNLIK